MSEHRRRHDHLGVVAAFENFQVRAASERGFDGDSHFTRLECERRDFFDAHIFFSVKNSSFHFNLSKHSWTQLCKTANHAKHANKIPFVCSVYFAVKEFSAAVLTQSSFRANKSAQDFRRAQIRSGSRPFAPASPRAEIKCFQTET